MNKEESFTDSLTVEQVRKILDALNIPWREYEPTPDGWISIPAERFKECTGAHLSHKTIGININHGGVVDHHIWGSEGMGKGDIVQLVEAVRFETLRENVDQAIAWIRKIINKPARSQVHLFRVDDAVSYGIVGAILLQGLRTWLDVNLAKRHNIRNGRVWTYNTAEDFTNYHPYLSPRQARYHLQNLEDEGIVLTGRFNKKGYDRTLWYSINEPEYAVSGKLSHFTKLSNGSDEIVKWK
jgi:hypothetical protein